MHHPMVQTIKHGKSRRIITETLFDYLEMLAAQTDAPKPDDR